MNGSWIKMQTKLCTDPRVLVAAKKCGVSRNEMIGGLFQLWCIADAHGGLLSAFDADMLDDVVRIEGFTDALPEAWIVVNDAGIMLPNYDEHNGSTAKRRASDTKRKAVSRKTSASDADKVRTREDKSREEKKKDLTTLDESPTAPKDQYPDDAFKKFWDTYPRTAGKKAAYNAWKKLTADERGTALSAVVKYRAATDRWSVDDKRFIKHGSTWLNAGDFETDPQEWERSSVAGVAANNSNRVSPEFQRPESYYDED